MLTFANAKINLGLNIVRRREDGYHDLETIFYPAGKLCGTPGRPGTLCDLVEIIEAQEDGLTELGLNADCSPNNNLAMRALRLFRERSAEKEISVPRHHIVLEKHIPFGAGVGGGSSDATAVLLTLNEIFERPFSEEELLSMANRLGADCPFFVVNSPVFAEGTGEKMEPVSLDLSDYWLALVKPDVAISTREAFSKITPRKPELSLKEIARMPIDRWKDLMVNDFEQSVFHQFPELRLIKERLYETGAVYASMTGSGSSFYGIFESESEARRAADRSHCPYRSITPLLP